MGFLFAGGYLPCRKFIWSEDLLSSLSFIDRELFYFPPIFSFLLFSDLWSGILLFPSFHFFLSFFLWAFFFSFYFCFFRRGEGIDPCKIDLIAIRIIGSTFESFRSVAYHFNILCTNKSSTKDKWKLNRYKNIDAQMLN